MTLLLTVRLFLVVRKYSEVEHFAPVTIKPYLRLKQMMVPANSMGADLHHRAIVIGSSIAGLLSARVLIDSFDLITIIERDKLPQAPEARRGVPQSTQPHVLFTRGYRILEELFPGIGSELSAEGAIPLDWAREFHNFGHGEWNATAESASDLVSVTCSRPLLEWTIRQQLSKFSKIQWLEQRRVTKLLWDQDKARVTGVTHRSVGRSAEEALAAQLVIDASGRGSQAPCWLEDLGFTPPEATVVNPLLGYATRRYQIPQGFEADWKVLLINHSPPDGTRLGYLAQIEAGEWIATLGGYGGDYPPLDPEGFLEFARSLPSAKFYEAIQDAQPMSRIYAHRATANRLYHYEKVTLPEGFIVLGDAVCALCPVYGQGMTVSAISALVLRDWLHKTYQGSNRHLAFSEFQKTLAKSNALPWALATGQDSRFPTTQGKSEPGRVSKVIGMLLSGYMNRLLQRANQVPQLHTLFLEVTQMLKPPTALYHPKVMLQVLRRN